MAIAKHRRKGKAGHEIRQTVPVPIVYQLNGQRAAVLRCVGVKIDTYM